MSGELVGTCIAVFLLGLGYGRLWVRVRALERRVEFLTSMRLSGLRRTP